MIVPLFRYTSLSETKGGQMKAQYQTTRPNTQPTTAVHQTEYQLWVQEQTASTTPASEKVWLIVVGALVMLSAGLCWFSNQPNGSYASLADAQPGSAGTRLRPADDRENPAELGLQAPVSATPTPETSPNERLIRRYYDEVLNRGRIAVMDELFAPEFGYRPDMTSTKKSDLAALKSISRETPSTALA